MPRKLPKIMGMSQREFKAEKRWQFKRVCKEIEDSDIRVGCAGLPGPQYGKLIDGIELIQQARKELAPWWKGA